MQQKFINIIAYIWTRFLSLNSKVPIAAAEIMFNESLTYILKSNYYDYIFEAYPKDVAEKVLNGYVCDLFNN